VRGQRDRQGRLKRRRYLNSCAADGDAGDLGAGGQVPDLVADLASDIDGNHEVTDLDIADVQKPEFAARFRPRIMAMTCGY
jgi:hypothetical protein